MERKITKPETGGTVSGASASPRLKPQERMLDSEAISAAKAARAKLIPEEQKKLDSALVEKAFSSREHDVKSLIAAGADIETVGDWHGLRLLSAVTREGIPKIAKVLIDSGADLEARGIRGFTALMISARYGRKEIVKMLLDAGADVDAKDHEGHAALHQASSAEVIGLLKAAGAKE